MKRVSFSKLPEFSKQQAAADKNGTPYTKKQYWLISVHRTTTFNGTYRTSPHPPLLKSLPCLCWHSYYEDNRLLTCLVQSRWRANGEGTAQAVPCLGKGYQPLCQSASCTAVNELYITRELSSQTIFRLNKIQCVETTLLLFNLLPLQWLTASNHPLATTLQLWWL